jgi:hypothetical protein
MPSREACVLRKKANCEPAIQGNGAAPNGGSSTGDRSTVHVLGGLG